MGYQSVGINRCRLSGRRVLEKFGEEGNQEEEPATERSIE